MDEPLFTEEDADAFRRWRHEADLAEPIIERDYAELAGRDGSWVAFHAGELVAHARHAEELRTLVEDAGQDWDSVFTRYLPGKDAVLVFSA